MARKERSLQAKQFLIENAGNEIRTKTRARQLYNYFYRRSGFFKFSIWLRVITIIFSIYLIYFNHIIISSEQEIISHYTVDETHFFYRMDSRNNKSIFIMTTDDHKYTIDLEASKPEGFAVNDTITVLKNIFVKKTYLSKLNSAHYNLFIKFERCNNYLIFVAGFSLLSFLLRDGYDFFSRLIMRSVLFFDLVGILIYFLV